MQVKFKDKLIELIDYCETCIDSINQYSLTTSIPNNEIEELTSFIIINGKNETQVNNVTLNHIISYEDRITYVFNKSISYYNSEIEIQKLKKTIEIMSGALDEIILEGTEE